MPLDYVSTLGNLCMVPFNFNIITSKVLNPLGWGYPSFLMKWDAPLSRRLDTWDRGHPNQDAGRIFCLDTCHDN